MIKKFIGFVLTIACMLGVLNIPQYAMADTEIEEAYEEDTRDAGSSNIIDHVEISMDFFKFPHRGLYAGDKATDSINGIKVGDSENYYLYISATDSDSTGFYKYIEDDFPNTYDNQIKVLEAGPIEFRVTVKAKDGYTFKDDCYIYISTDESYVFADSLINKGDKLIFGLYTNVNEDLVGDFVKRLYKICLDRSPDKAGFNDWCNRLRNGDSTGVSAAYGFIFSNEFNNKNLCNKHYVEYLYKAFLGRNPDSAGKKNWVKELESGKTREEVFNGFALSKEFGSICDKANIYQGSGISIPKYGTVPKGPCSVCGKEDGVTSFVKRLYKVCLNRNADPAGLKDWTNQLWNHTASGSQVAYGFIFSPEFVNKKYSNSDYVEYLYKAFMGRSSDKAGKADWLNRMANGWTRKQVFDGFVGSQEFTKICQSYGILR